jgi:predicted Zn finger-like uncharacterized protein
MTCPNCKTKMALTTQYVGPDGKIVRVYTCPQCGFIKKG